MSQQGPLLVVSNAGRPSFATALDDAELFPVIEVAFADAAKAVAQVQPSAVLADMQGADHATFEALARLIAARKPYLPLIAVEPESLLPDNAIPFSPHGGKFDRLIARLNAALRVRSLHMTVLRRLSEEPITRLPETDPAREATVLLIGRGGAYPALSVALGERLGVVGAFSIEAAANHLNTRDIDGIVLGEGFTTRVVHAFLTVLSEDTRFRKLPVALTTGDLAPSYELPNLEIIMGEPAAIAANALPLIRQHAFEARLGRTLRAVDAEGLLDPQTGLLSKATFDRDFPNAVRQTLADGGGLSVARFSFETGQSPCAARWRADHQPVDAADGFRRRAKRRLRDRGVRQYRPAQRPRNRAPALRGDAPHRERPAQCAFGAFRHRCEPAAAGFGEIAAGAALRRRTARRVLTHFQSAPGTIVPRLH